MFPRNLFFILLLVNIKSISFCQTPAIQWEKCYGGTSDEGFGSIIQTADNGYIVAGGTESNDGDVSGYHGGSYDDAWVAKIDSAGKLRWQKCIGGTNGDAASSIVQTRDGGYVFAGSTESDDGDVTGNHGMIDAWIVKLSNAGVLQWQKCYGGSQQDLFNSIKQTADGGYIASGYTQSRDGDVTGLHGPAGGPPDYWVVKVDSAGKLQWQKCLGGDNTDYGGSVEQTSDGDYIVSGYSASDDYDVSGNHGGAFDIWLVKLDSAGTIKWQKCFGGSLEDRAFSMQITKDGGVILAGNTNSHDGDVVGNNDTVFNNYWVVKTDSLGNLQHQKCLGGSSDDEAYSVIQTSDGGYIVSGETLSNDGDVSGNHGSYDYWVVKLDTALNMEWQKCFGGSAEDASYTIHQTNDSGYIVAGTTLSNDIEVSGNHGSSDIWVVKLSPAPLGVPKFNKPEKEIAIYPNPVTNQFTINNPQFSIKQIEIYNVLGVSCLKSEIINPKSEISIDVSAFSAGVYFVQASSEIERMVLKFVKE